MISKIPTERLEVFIRHSSDDTELREMCLHYRAPNEEGPNTCNCTSNKWYNYIQFGGAYCKLCVGDSY